MHVLKKSLQIGFVAMLSLVFVFCSGSGNKAGNHADSYPDYVADIDTENDDSFENMHTYSVFFDRGDEIISFLGDAQMGDRIASMYIKDGKGYVGEKNKNEVITLVLEQKDMLSIDALFVLDKDGKPLPFKHGMLSDGLGSTLRIVDPKSGGVYTAISGTAVISNLKTAENAALGEELVSSYSLEYDAEFNLLMPDTGENTIFHGSGEVEVVPFKK